MNAHLIFYCASQVYNNENAVAESLKRAKINISNVTAVFNDNELAENIKKSVNESDIVLICGDISDKSGKSINDIISDTLKDGDYSINSVKKLSHNSVIMQSKKISIVLLPDNPENISEIAENDLLGYISRGYKIRLKALSSDKAPSTESIVEDINNAFKDYDFNKDIPQITEEAPTKYNIFNAIKSNIGFVFLGLGIILLTVIVIFAIIGSK